MSGTGAPLPLVVIYSRRDGELLSELLDHLSPLEHQRLIKVWYDRDLEPGVGWLKEIEAHLKEARIVLVLVSASCLASTHCQTEISLALDLRRTQGLRVVPVKLHEVDWEGEPLSELQMLPKNGDALSASANRHAAMAEIARAIRKLATAEIPMDHRQETGDRRERLAVRGINDQALALADLGDLPSARALLESAVHSAREARSSDLAVLLSNYAHILRAAGELEAARGILEEALMLTSPSDPALAIRLDRLAGVLRELGEPELAKNLAEQALGISLQAHGKRHPAVAVRRNTLGLILTDLGKPQEAIREFKKAISILLRCREERHPALAAVRGNLALALRDRGDLRAAVRHAEQALADDGEAYLDHHPAVAADLNTLGLILRDQGEISAAVRSLRKAQKIFSQVYGDFHPSTRAVRDNLRTTILPGRLSLK